MNVVDDGLFRPEVGEWAEEKHSVVSLYAKLFSTGMKGKWDERVYLELYAGSGFAKIKHTARVIAGSPIRALLLEHPFDKYIFCERQTKELDSLKQRGGRMAPSRKVSYILGDCNERVDEILAEMPAYSIEPPSTVTVLCRSV